MKKLKDQMFSCKLNKNKVHLFTTQANTLAVQTLENQCIHLGLLAIPSLKLAKAEFHTIARIQRNLEVKVQANLLASQVMGIKVFQMKGLKTNLKTKVSKKFLLK